MRKQNDLSNGRRIGQQHHQAVNSDALTGRRRHAVFQGFNIVVIHEMRFTVTGFSIFHLLQKSSPLVFRVVEFGEPVGDFPSGDEQFKPFCQVRMGVASSGQWRDFGRVAGDKGGLDQLGFDKGIEQLGNEFFPGGRFW